MKKPIKEIQEQASKGPFKTDSIFSSAYVLDAETYAICNMPSGSPNKKANAHLIAHCLNNFQPMLEALDSFVRGIEACLEKDDPVYKRLEYHYKRQKQALKDAQEVEV